MQNFEMHNNTDIKYAREIRKKRSEIKESLKTKKTSISEIFKDPEIYDKYIANMRIIEIVSSLPGIGRVKAEKMLRDMGISFCKRIGGLGKKQRSNFDKYFNIEDT